MILAYRYSMSALCIKNRLTQINSELWAKLGYIQPAKTNYTTDKLKVLTPGSIFRCIFFVFLTLVQTSFTFNLLHYRWANFFKFILIQSTAVSRKGVKQLFGCKTLRQLKKKQYRYSRHYYYYLNKIELRFDIFTVSFKQVFT